MNKKSERVWMEEVIDYFKVLAQNLPRGTDNNHIKPWLGLLVSRH
jgi:hypothetical protein